MLPTPPAGPVFPHTRSHALHWLGTAAVLAAVTAAASLLPSADATAARPEGQRLGPDPSGVAFPLDCGPFAALVTHRVTVDMDRDSRPETVAAVRCDAGGGSPPHAVYLLTGAAGGVPRIAETLVDAAQGMIVDELAADADTVTVTLLGYSGMDVPRSAPDLHGEATWSWRDGELVTRRAVASGGTSQRA